MMKVWENKRNGLIISTSSMFETNTGKLVAGRYLQFAILLDDRMVCCIERHLLSYTGVNQAVGRIFYYLIFSMDVRLPINIDSFESEMSCV